MRRIAAFICAAVILSLPRVAVPSNVQSSPAAPDQGDEKVIAGTVVAENATVRAIDPTTRTVTLQMRDGKEQTFVVDQAVKRLGEVQVGDIVKALYLEAVSVKINKNKVPSGVNVVQTVQRDEKSPTPAGATGVTMTTTANITKIFDDGKKVTLMLPDGTTTDVAVRDPENLAKIKSGEVKEGDQIEISFHRALALSVEKSIQQ